MVVNQQPPQGQENNRNAKSPSYFRRLFAPENLPNLALVGVGIAGIVVAICSLRKIERQIVEMQRQRDIMGKQVEAAVLQVRAMQEQITEMSQQTEQSKALLEIERRTLILQYRPKIIVRNAKALNFSFDLGKPWECEIRFTVVNTGGSPAHIIAGTRMAIVSCIARDIGNIELKDGDEFLFTPFTLQPGQQVIVEESLSTGTVFSLDWENFRQGLKTTPLRYLFLMGTIYYMDDLNIPRSTGFSRTYDTKTKSFTPRKDEEDEYTD